MEIRKVQVTGGGSYVLSLPKTWVKQQNIQKNESLGVVANLDGSLLLTQDLDYDNSVRVKELPLKDYPDPEILYRALIGAYITGFTQMKITSAGRIPPKVRVSVREFINATVGQEVAEETDNSIVIKDILNPAEMQYVSTIVRMSRIMQGMHEDAMIALEQNRRDLVVDAVIRYRDIRRIHLLVSRSVLLIVSNPALAREMMVQSPEAELYYQMSQLLFEIGSYENVIAEAVDLLLASGVDHTVTAKIRALGDLTMAYTKRSLKTAYDATNLMAPMKVIAEYKEFREEYRSFVNDIPRMPPQDIVAITTISSSLLEIAKRSCDFAKIMFYAHVGTYPTERTILNPPVIK